MFLIIRFNEGTDSYVLTRSERRFFTFRGCPCTTAANGILQYTVLFRFVGICTEIREVPFFGIPQKSVDLDFPCRIRAFCGAEHYNAQYGNTVQFGRAVLP